MKFSYDEFVLYKQLFNGILMKDFQLTPLIENDVIRQIIQNDHRMENGNLSVERINELIMSARIEDFSEIDTTNTDELELAGEIYMYVNLLKSNVSLQSATDVHIFITKLNKWLFKYGKSGGTTREGPVRISGKTVKTSEPSKIMADLMGLANEFVSDNDEFILKITTYHHGFTVVHPFTDGNGRTARGFLNKQLQNHQLPMVVIKLDERDKYHDALEHADSGSLDALELFVMRHIVLSYVKIMSKLPDLTNFK